MKAKLVGALRGQAPCAPLRLVVKSSLTISKKDFKLYLGHLVSNTFLKKSSSLFGKFAYI